MNGMLIAFYNNYFKNFICWAMDIDNRQKIKLLN